MAEFVTGKKLDEKLTDIIWNAKKELVILSPFIRLDKYCRSIFKKLKNKPELEVVIVFGKNENNAERSLTQEDLEIFMELSNVAIIYCSNLHAKFYANESEGLITSLNLLGKCMTGNVEYGIVFHKSIIHLEKLYTDTMYTTYHVVTENPCIYVKRPVYKKINLGLSKKYLESEVLVDMTNALYNNRTFKKQLYKDFPLEIIESDVKPKRENLVSESKTKYLKPTRESIVMHGYCIRTGQPIPFNPDRPYCYEAYQSWAQFGNRNYREKYCHRTGKKSNGATSMANPIMEF